MKWLIVIAVLFFGGCMAEPTIVECKMIAENCECECRAIIDNPIQVKVGL